MKLEKDSVEDPQNIPTDNMSGLKKSALRYLPNYYITDIGHHSQ